ncbi:site-specific DNA-methyltransferase [Priestia aryabhattai]|uniref:site-specific DNA-methyltransferase n=1 Tax=Priestia aryabhattai TaxID=412384 RepID=UPI001C8D614D|nr:site-specific DNA-methyltransferase [Priestia aryabhattai]MBY0062359.1 site-specific DNA-methyltransferase [Priestia aryabhattai]
MSVEELTRQSRVDEERIQKLKELFPEAFTDGRLNLEILRNEVSEIDEELIEVNTEEAYGLQWVGKKEARRIAFLPSKGTLKIAKGEGVNEDLTKNVYIEGDNLEVLRILQKPYQEKIKMIYIDPPYNTGNDFIYKDDFKDSVNNYLGKSGQLDESEGLLTSNPKASGRFHANWLNMMYPRLKLARNLLRTDGVIFVSIDENEQANLKKLMDEIFGEENFIDSIVWKKRYGGGAKEKYLVTVHETILFYAKSINNISDIYVPLSEDDIKRYYKSKDSNFTVRGPYRTHPLEATKSVGERKNLIFPIPGPDGKEILPRKQWWWDRDRVMTALSKGELEFVKSKSGDYTVHTKQYLRDENGIIRKTKAQSIIDDIFTQHGTKEIEKLFGDSTVFPFPKPSELIQRLGYIAGIEDGDIVLDFFSGSGTTAQAIMNLNKEIGINCKFILVQLPEKIQKGNYSTIAEIGKERIRKSIQLLNEQDNNINEFDRGFRVYKLGKTTLQKWSEYTGGELEQLEAKLDNLISDHFTEGWTTEDIIIELMLNQGFPVDSMVTLEKEIIENNVWTVTHSHVPFKMHVCLDEKLNELTTKYLVTNFSKDVFVCLDDALFNEMKVSLSEAMKVKTI